MFLKIYEEMAKAQKELAFPAVVDLVAQAVQRYLAEMRQEAWRRDFRKLQQHVRAKGGFKLGDTKEEIITKLREQRRQIFEADYAHLY